MVWSTKSNEILNLEKMTVYSKEVWQVMDIFQMLIHWVNSQTLFINQSKFTTILMSKKVKFYISKLKFSELNLDMIDESQIVDQGGYDDL